MPGGLEGSTWHACIHMHAYIMYAYMYTTRSKGALGMPAHICMHTYAHIRTRVHTHAHVRTRGVMRTHARTHACALMQVRTHARTHACALMQVRTSGRSPAPRFAHAMCLVGDSILVHGGVGYRQAPPEVKLLKLHQDPRERGKCVFGDVHVLDPVTCRWYEPEAHTNY